MAKASFLAATGMVGSGFLEETFERGLEMQPDFIGCDSGSVDDGPNPLGAGQTLFGRDGVKRDVRLMVLGARRNGIPLLIGSSGGSGSRRHLAWMRDIVEEIAREEGLHFTLGLVDSEQDVTVLKRKLVDGRIRPLAGAPELTEDVLDRSSTIVGMQGAEAFQGALDAGADIVIAGRTTDASIYAAVPLAKGVAPGPVWHAAKTLECGAAPVESRRHPDSMYCEVDDEGFTIVPLNPTMRCTPGSVASHGLYENRDPYLIHEPSGTINTLASTYAALDDRRVRVEGSAFEEADVYTVKLEGAEMVGYQSLVLGAVRDPVILRQFEKWLKGCEEAIEARCAQIYSGSGYRFTTRVYGGDPSKAEEVVVLMDMTAETQDMARTLALSAAHIALHYPVPEWSGLISTLAFPYSPHCIDRGPVYRFSLNHVVELDDPLELCRIETVEV
ncbi:MAG: acyclic terpene utilization AtuA family protein [Acidimicrobiia bacterium]